MTEFTSKLSRRKVFAGAGAAGALAAVAVAVPMVRSEPQQPVAVAPSSQPNDGYQLTEHVKQYYRTARV